MAKGRFSRKKTIYNTLLMMGPLSFNDLAWRVATLEKLETHTNLERFRKDFIADLNAGERFYLRSDRRWGLANFGAQDIKARKKLIGARKRRVNFNKAHRRLSSKTPRVRFWRG